MTRSVRRQPFIAHCGNGKSQKRDKQRGNRRFRAAVKSALASSRILPTMREIVSIYDWAQDGSRHYCSWPMMQTRRKWATFHDWRRWAKAK